MSYCRGYYICSNPECQKEFYGRRRTETGIYCSSKCFYKNKTMDAKKCLCCNNLFSPDNSKQKYCSNSCSTTYNNLKRDKSVYEKIKKSQKAMAEKRKTMNTTNADEVYCCKFCGNPFQKYPDKAYPNKLGHTCVGKEKRSLLKTMQKYFGLSLMNIGTEKFQNDILDCIQYVKSLYDQNSAASIAKLVGHPDKSGKAMVKILNSMGIELLTQKEGILKSWEREISNPPVPKKYKSGYITLNGKTYFYRSSYELELAQILADKKIEFDMEKVRIKYYDSQKKRKRIAIPDFVFEKEKIIVEVKSRHTFKENEMKDRFEAFSELGYTNYLWLEKEFYVLKHDNFIKITDENFYDIFQCVK